MLPMHRWFAILFRDRRIVHWRRAHTDLELTKKNDKRQRSHGEWRTKYVRVAENGKTT